MLVCKEKSAYEKYVEVAQVCGKIKPTMLSLLYPEICKSQDFLLYGLLFSWEVAFCKCGRVVKLINVHSDLVS